MTTATTLDVELGELTGEWLPCPESTRRPGVEGLPFVLADGRPWHLARSRVYFSPSVEFRSDFPPPDEDGNRVVVSGSSLPREVVSLAARRDFPRSARPGTEPLIEAIRSDAGEVPYLVMARAGIALVMACHDLTIVQAARLFEMTGEELQDIAVGILRMFLGEADATDQEEPVNQSSEV